MQISESIISLLFTYLFTGAAEFLLSRWKWGISFFSKRLFWKNNGVNFNSLTLTTFKITLIEVEPFKYSRTSLLSKALVKLFFSIRNLRAAYCVRFDTHQHFVYLYSAKFFYLSNHKASTTAGAKVIKN